MTHRIATGPELTEALAAAIATENKIDLAVAFWGAGAADRLGLAPGRPARIICNLAMGATNPAEVRLLQEFGAEVRQHDTLHAKIGIIGEHLSFAGSSNMSTNGLGAEGEGWEEANVIWDCVDPGVQMRFEALWGAARGLTDKDLAIAEEQWRARRALYANDPAAPKPKRTSMWTAITSNSAKLRGFPVVVAYYEEMTDAEKALSDSAEEDIERMYGKGLDVFLEWDKLPHCYIIAAERPRGGIDNVELTGISFRWPGAPTYKRDKKPFQITKSVSQLPGFAAPRGNDLSEFKALIRSYVRTKKKPHKSRIIPIADLMDHYAKTKRP